MAATVDKHNQTVISELQPGDMVEFKRIKGIYSHFGVYVGNGDIVHLTVMSEFENLSQSPSGLNYGKACVKREKLMKVAGDSKAYKANKDTERKPLPADQIVKNALSKIGEVGYDLVDYNCEHFANWCRYGKKISDQIETLVKVVRKGKECVVAFLREEAEKVTHASQ